MGVPLVAAPTGMKTSQYMCEYYSQLMCDDANLPSLYQVTNTLDISNKHYKRTCMNAWANVSHSDYIP